MLGNKKTTKSGSLSGSSGSSGASASTTLVSRETAIKGDVHFSGNLEVEGLIQGNIVAEPGRDAVVRVVDEGRVEGEIHAPTIIINGSVKGDVHSSSHLELAAKARVQGNVFYSLVEMAMGSEVNGSLAHKAESDASTRANDSGFSLVESDSSDDSLPVAKVD